MNSRNNDNLVEISDEAMVSLMAGVGARPKPGADVEQAVYEHSRSQWRSMQAARKRRKNYAFLAAAAVVVLAILIKPVFFSAGYVNGTPIPLGTVNKLKGTVYVDHDGLRSPLNDTSNGFHTLYSGDSIIAVADSGVSVKWGAGSTIRLDQNSQLVLNNANEISLVEGRVYVDIPGQAGGGASPKLAVLTHLGIVKHIGTQFIVSSQPDTVQVAVREGSVSISNDRQSLVAPAGYHATLDSAEHIIRETAAVSGPEWLWAEQLAPAFEVEGKALYEVLAQISRETGKPVFYDSIDAERIANTTIMHGSINEDPEKALEIVLQTNALSWFEKDGKVHLFVRQ